MKDTCKIAINCSLISPASGCLTLRYEMPYPWVEEHSSFLYMWSGFYNLEQEKHLLGFIFQALIMECLELLILPSHVL